MATLFVANVPEDRYEALRQRAKENRRSIAAEVISLLEETVPTPKELKRRRESIQKLRALMSRPPLMPGPFPSAEEMVREDRER